MSLLGGGEEAGRGGMGWGVGTPRCPPLSPTIDAVALLNKFISVLKAGILIKRF